jgi:hypothetical protein
MAVDPLTFWPKCEVQTCCCFSLIYNFIFHFLHWYTVSPVQESFLESAIIAQLVAFMPMEQATHIWLPSRFFF